jgi:hypothetical protein
MKPIHFSITSLLLLLLPLFANAQTVSINEFYRKYKHADAEKVAVSVPGWIVRMGIGIAKSQAEDQEEKDALKVLRKVGKVRVLTFEDSNPIRDKDLDRLMKGVRRERFEDLVMVREHATKVHIMMRERREKIKNLLILVNEEDTFTMVSLKTKVKYDEIEELINKAIQEDEEGGVEVKL